MPQLDRRTFLRGSAAAAGAAVLGGPFQGFVARAANAAAIGVSESEAAVVVSRGLLENLGRDETQAVVGHLIGCIANGDLRILAGLNAVFQSVGRNGWLRSRRNCGSVSRSGVATASASSAPLAQIRPRLAGASATPRMRRGVPAAPSTRSRHPTPQ